MMTDLERLDVYQRALKATIKQQAAKLGRRVRVLDAGCGIGLLGLSPG
jgi:2-polyprenyl-3-methyl-5-hydroxy-6-metoxy-1,4-benzoquinol methylase